jgi:cobalt-zinc-cadmium efflux system outer membrane protein
MGVNILRAPLGAIAAALAFAGCWSAPKTGPSSIPGPQTRAVADEGGRRQAAPAPPGAGPAGELTLEDAIALCLLHSPELKVFEWEIRAADARSVQAGRRPNPEFGIELEDVLGSGEFADARAAQTTFRFSQLVELGDKRPLREEAAGRAKGVAEAAYHAASSEVFGELLRRFFHVVGDQHELELAQQATRLAETTLAAVQERVQAGKASALEEHQARIHLARSRLVLEHSEHELAAARRRLAAVWGDSAPSFTRAEADLFRRRTLPPVEEIERRLERGPELARRASELRWREAERRLAESKRVPSLLVEAGLRRHEGPDDEALVFGVSLPLPIFDRNQGGLAEADALHEKSRAQSRSSEARLRAVLFGLYQESLHAVAEMEAYEREIEPQSSAALALTEAGFRDGRYSLVELLAAQRGVIEGRLAYLKAATDYHDMVVEIEAILGEPLSP